MKKLFTAVGIAGAIFVMGAAGMADTFTNNEHMFTTLLVGLGLLGISAAGLHIQKERHRRKVLIQRIERLKASA